MITEFGIEGNLQSLIVSAARSADEQGYELIQKQALSSLVVDRLHIPEEFAVKHERLLAVGIKYNAPENKAYHGVSPNSARTCAT